MQKGFSTKSSKMQVSSTGGKAPVKKKTTSSKKATKKKLPISSPEGEIPITKVNKKKPVTKKKEVPSEKTSRLVTESFIFFKTNEYLDSTDLVQFIIALPLTLRKTRLVSKGKEISLPSTASETTLLRLSSVRGIERLSLYIPKDIWLLSRFTDLKKLTLHWSTTNIKFNMNFIEFLTKLETLSLNSIFPTGEEVKLFPSSLRELTLSNESYEEFVLSKNLSSLTQLTKLKIEARSVPFRSNSPIVTSILENLINLTSLYIDMKYFGNAEQMMLLAKHPNLQELEIVYSENIGSTNLKYIGKMANLTKLNLCHCLHITDASIHCLTSLTNLRDLTLSEIGLDDDCLDSIATLSELEVLNLAGSDITTLGPLTRLGKLSSLNVSDCETLSDFTGLEKLTFLTSFLADQTQVTTDVMSQVYKFPLTELILDNVNPGPAPLRGKNFFLKQLAEMKNLTRLKLAGLDPTNEELKVISSLTNLRYLDLTTNFEMSDCYDDEGLAHLAELTNLTELNVYGNSNLTSEGMAYCLPKLKFLTNLCVGSCYSLDANFFPVLLELPNLKLVHTDDGGDDKTFVETNELYLAFKRARPFVSIHGVGPAEENLERQMVRIRVKIAKARKAKTVQTKLGK